MHFVGPEGPERELLPLIPVPLSTAHASSRGACRGGVARTPEQIHVPGYCGIVGLLFEGVCRYEKDNPAPVPERKGKYFLKLPCNNP